LAIDEIGADKANGTDTDGTVCRQNIAVTRVCKLEYESVAFAISHIDSFRQSLNPLHSSTSYKPNVNTLRYVRLMT